MGISEIQEHLEGICAEIESLPAIPDDAMTYPELKMQLMVNYVSNLAFYVSLKHRGVQNIVSEHPVFAHLAYLRTFMERLVPMDASLKYQIDKLLMEVDAEVMDGGKTTSDEGSAGPNLAAFVPSAVKRITADQVVKKQGIMEEHQYSSRLEIDPSLIAEQIRNAQSSAGGKKKRRKVKTYVEEDSEKGSEIEEEAEFERTKSSGKSKVAKKVPDEDEDIDSDDSDI